jgi:hypothetical protein
MSGKNLLDDESRLPAGVASKLPRPADQRADDPEMEYVTEAWERKILRALLDTVRLCRSPRTNTPESTHSPALLKIPAAPSRSTLRIVLHPNEKARVEAQASSF